MFSPPLEIYTLIKHLRLKYNDSSMRNDQKKSQKRNEIEEKTKQKRNKFMQITFTEILYETRYLRVTRVMYG